MKFDDGSYLAIEVVYTHAPDRDVHELYKENMVDIRLKELDEIHDDGSIDGSDCAIEEFKPAQRKARWEARQRVFETGWLIQSAERNSPVSNKTTVIDLDDIRWFEEENTR